MSTKAKGIRISDELDAAIARESAARGKSWSAMTAELLEEAIRMRRVPGIAFVDGPAGRRAVVSGTGLDVWKSSPPGRRAAAATRSSGAIIPG